MSESSAEMGPEERERRWAAVRARMESAREILALRGSIASRLTAGGRRVASLRYREEGREGQRAIYLGDDAELVQRARALLEEFRHPERQVREVEDFATFARLLVTFLCRQPGPGSRKLRRPGR